MSKTIKTIVFDIGNVLMTYDWEGYLNTLFPDNLIISEIRDSLAKCDFWKIMDLGLMSEDKLVSLLQNSAPNYPNEIIYTYQNLGNSLKRCDYSIPWILELKESGLQVLYLSNYSYNTICKNPDIFDFLNFMDGGILSSEVHMLKPNELIFNTLFEKYDVSPSASLLIDDDLSNIEAASGLGMDTILFQNYAQAHLELLDKII